MADWRKLAKALALADGRIDTKETDIIKKELYADGKIDRSEIEWLLDLRKSSTGSVQAFDQLVFGALKTSILADGSIDAKEAAWLTKFIFADGKVDDAEKAFLSDLRAGAKSVGAEFLELCKKCGV